MTHCPTLNSNVVSQFSSSQAAQLPVPVVPIPHAMICCLAALIYVTLHCPIPDSTIPTTVSQVIVKVMDQPTSVRKKLWTNRKGRVKSQSQCTGCGQIGEAVEPPSKTCTTQDVLHVNLDMPVTLHGTPCAQIDPAAGPDNTTVADNHWPQETTEILACNL